MDESDLNTRVTRKSARRLTTDSLNESVLRADTPTKTPTTLPRAASKLESIAESGLASKGRALLLDSPRRSRKPSEEPAAASPFRRVTRASSNERDITSSPLPARTRRRSVTAGSDTEDAQTSSSETAVKSARKKRQSILPIIEQIKEEAEEDIEAPSQQDPDVTVLNTDELELRTRSISKSPSVHSPSKSSLNGSSNDVSKGRDELASLDDSKIVQSGSDKRKSEEFNTSVKESASKDTPKANKSAVKSPAAASPMRAPASVEKRKPIRPITESPSVNSLNTSSKKTEDELASLDESQKEEEPKKIFKSRNNSSGDASPSADILLNISCTDLTPIQAFTSKKRIAQVSKHASARDTQSISIGGQSTLNGNCDLTILSSEDMQVDEDDTGAMNMDISKVEESTINITQVASANSDKSKDFNTSQASMDVTPIERANIDKRKSKDFNTSIKESATIGNGQASQSSPGTASPKPRSLLGYIGNVEKVRDSRKSQSRDDTISPNEDRVHFWSQAVTHAAADAIDAIDQTQREETVIVEAIPERVLREKSISSDESEDEEDQHERNEFIYDEADVGTDDSITESERNYLLENEIPDDGESLGSQDSYEASCDEDEDEEEADEENDEEDIGHFLDDDEISNTYSMDEREEEIESPLKPKRRSSRIIVPSSSSSEDEIESATDGKQTSPDKLQALETSVVVAKSPAPVQNGQSPAKVSKATPSKSPVSSTKKKAKSPALPDRMPEEPTAPEESFTKASVEKARKVSKRKRDSVANAMEEVSAVKSNTKRSRIDPGVEDDESEAVQLENVSGITELAATTSDSEPEVHEKPVKAKNNPLDLTSLLESCSDYMSTHNEEKRAKMALKREKKAQKLAKKKQEEATLKETSENLDSSNSSNKENDAKKKKKNKAKKQKPVEELPEKESMARSVSKQQEKMELKRQRKKEKKLAKQQQQAEDEENTPVVEKAAEELEKSAKKKKTKKPKIHEDEVPAVVEPEPEVVPKKKSKKFKTVEAEEAAIEPEVATIEPEVGLEVSSEKKKKKKNLADVSSVEAEPTPKKKQQQHDDNETVDEPEPQEKNKKKTKKRKLEEVLEQEEPQQKKKKLNILTQIENSPQFEAPHRETQQFGQQEAAYSMSLSSQKLKAVIPPQLEVTKKQKKKSGARKHIPEPRKSLPRPVWASTGWFLEEPVSPYKFSSTEYKSINAGASSTNFGVVQFEAAKKKKQAVMPPPAQDFKTKAMFRNMKRRDASQKNIRGLLSQRNK